MSTVHTEKQTGSHAGTPVSSPVVPGETTFWRVEGSLLNLSAVRPVAFFTWNAQSFSERWLRRSILALSAIIRPLLYAADRVFATRFLHTLLRGISRDRLDLLGEEYFHYYLKPKLKPEGIAKLKEAMAGGEKIVLVSQGLEHVIARWPNIWKSNGWWPTGWNFATVWPPEDCFRLWFARVKCWPESSAENQTVVWF